MTTLTFLAWGISLAVITQSTYGQTCTNSVVREIGAESGTLLIKDTICLPKTTWETVPVLRRILHDNDGLLPVSTNSIQALLAGEDLEVDHFDLNRNGAIVTLHLKSRVKLREKSPARLHLLPTFAGYSISKAIGSGTDSDLFLLVFSVGGASVAWFPDWVTTNSAVDAMSTTVDLNYLFKRFVKVDSGLLLRSDLATPVEVVTLLQWMPESAPPDVPNSDFVSTLDRAHKISGNDVLKLFTNVKLGKPGYYVLDRTGFTNSPPLSSGQTNAFKAKPFDQERLEQLRH